MATVKKSVLIERSSQEMFDLVDRVEDYPEFLPWCSQTFCQYRDASKTVATVHINYRNVKSHFTTANDKESPLWMRITLVDGPFRRLDGLWRFTTLAAHACKIEFHLSYEFSSRMLEKAIGPVFSQIANTFIDAFVKRANQIQRAPHG
ncbi:MAG: type II toxin-antitoxin system RatA family toxin [Candidatus Accumulibacter sp.]|uniref:type II toxin-antitoxin system RatA family toxin n=1 Tax=Accumulibacter sp. TaxID=2053492 RepID=UPI00287A702C|nr:type II toxin-antitoxin system RatA family toxin [Accumulibacter sp.]MDS4015666.1 type II toxin-antitoxin system RatA family toxin [Accumulibacter sp.]